jgi:integrase
VAAIRKRGRRWYCEVRVRGVREGQTFATKAEAAAWALQREAEARGERLPTATVGDAIRRYMREVAPGERGERWTLVRCTAMLRDDLARIPLATLTATDLSAWRDERLKSVKPPTVRREMTVWRGVLEQCRREWGWLRVNPIDDVRRPSPGAARERRVSDDEMDRMRLALGWPIDTTPETHSQQVALLMLLAVETAMRAGELLSLGWEQIDLEGRSVRLTRTKNGDSRDVPLSRRAVALFALMQSEEGKRSGQVFSVPDASRDTLWRKARTRAGIGDARFHDLRHEATTRLARHLDVLDLARMTGHRDLGMLRRYYNPTSLEIAGRLDAQQDAKVRRD